MFIDLLDFSNLRNGNSMLLPTFYLSFIVLGLICRNTRYELLMYDVNNFPCVTCYFTLLMSFNEQVFALNMESIGFEIHFLQ